MSKTCIIHVSLKIQNDNERTQKRPNKWKDIPMSMDWMTHIIKMSIYPN